MDLDTKVYGTDNLFVVDASFHPDLPTGNTQAIVMVAAEAAAKKVLAVKVSGGDDTPAPSSTVAATSASSVVSSTAAASSAAVTSAPGSASITSAPTAITSETATFSGTTAVTSVSVPSPVYTEVPMYGRCGGIGYEGPTKCAPGSKCKYQNDWYYQCV